MCIGDFLISKIFDLFGRWELLKIHNFKNGRIWEIAKEMERMLEMQIRTCSSAFWMPKKKKGRNFGKFHFVPAYFVSTPSIVCHFRDNLRCLLNVPSSTCNLVVRNMFILFLNVRFLPHFRSKKMQNNDKFSVSASIIKSLLCNTSFQATVLL